MPMSPLRDVVDEYPMRRVLAASPHCTVYESVRTATDESVAVKLINSGGGGELQQSRQRFTRAMGAIQFLRPAGFPELHDFGFAADNSAFMVMELVDGVPLAALADGPPVRLVRALVQVVETLEQLARGDVFHSNISPDNVLVEVGADPDQVKIVGFGTAAYLEEGRRGALLGHSPDSDRFTAPERFDAAAEPVDSKSDLYSLALVTCELLGAAVSGLGSATPTVVLPAAVCAHLGTTAELEQILATALNADPAARTLDHTVLRAALLAVLESAPTSSEAPILPPEPEPAVPTLAGEWAEAALEFDGDAEGLVDWDAGDDASEEPLPREVDILTDGVAGATVDDAPTTMLAPPPPPPPPPTDVDDDDTGFDPNKTDPALDPSALLPPPVEVAAEEPPDDGLAATAVFRAGGADTVSGNAGLEATLVLPPPTDVAEETPPRVVPAAMPVVPPAPTVSGRRLPYAVAAIAAVVVLIVFMAVVAGVRSRRAVAIEEPLPVTAEVVPTVLPTPLPAPTEASPQRINLLLEEAHRLMADDDRDGAAEVLDGLTDDEIDGFNQAEQAIYDELVAMLEGASQERAISDLQGGLEVGSIRMLQRGVAAVSKLSTAEIKREPGLAEQLARAREVLRLHAALWRAHDADDNPAVLESAAAMMKALPKYSTPLKFRDQAARALEAQAEGAAAAGHFDVALSVLGPVERSYPQREGLAKKLAGYRRQQAAQAELAPLIDTALAKGAAGQPEAGLKMLTGREAVPGLEGRLAEARSRLDGQFAKLDAAPPQLTLPAQAELAYKKNRDITLPVEVSDDYRVVRVRAMVRPEGASEFHAMALAPAADGRYVIEIPASLHGNGAVAVYVEAEDSHGHTGRLGSPSEPIVIDRKGFFKRIFGG